MHPTCTLFPFLSMYPSNAMNRHVRHSVITLSLVLAALSITCDHNTTTVQESEQQPGVQIPGEVSSKRRAELIERFPSVTVGMSPEQVTRVLGKPDDDYLAGPKDPWAPPKSRMFVYYLKRVDGGGNIRDQKIEVVFNPVSPQKVENILAINVAELAGESR